MLWCSQTLAGREFQVKAGTTLNIHQATLLGIWLSLHEQRWHVHAYLSLWTSVAWNSAPWLCADNGTHGCDWVHRRRLQHLLPDSDRAAVRVDAVQRRNSDTERAWHPAVHGRRWYHPGARGRGKGDCPQRSRLDHFMLLTFAAVQETLGEVNFG